MILRSSKSNNMTSQESTPLNQGPLAGQQTMTTPAAEEPKSWFKQVLIGFGTIIRASVSINLFMILPYIVVHRGGDFVNAIIDEHVYLIPNSWSTVKWNIWQFYALTGLLTVWGSISILFLGGRKYYGPPTLSGHRPEYTHSGFRFYLISMAVTVPLIAVYDVKVFYTEFTSLIAVLNVYGFFFSIFLYVKSVYWPSNTNECIRRGNFIVDIWEGVELYPRIGTKLDLKTLITCRHCLFLLQILYLMMIKTSYELKQDNNWTSVDTVNWSMLSVTVLQTIYLGKWFYWEDGYKNTIDFIVERGGYYLFNACISLIPSLYLLYNLFMVTRTPVRTFGPTWFTFVTLLGAADIFCIYWADRQRQLCRESDGNCTIWGKPAEVLRVNYVDANGKERKSLLLSSGFWGWSRHPNHFFEICMFVIWSLPAVFSDPILGLWYSVGTPVFVFLIMFDRGRKDDAKCRAKYGSYWDDYCKRVPYKIIPFIY